MDVCRGRTRVIVVNNSYQLAPWADLLYFADARWYKWHQDALKGFTPPIATLDNTGIQQAHPRVYSLHRGAATGLSSESDTLNTGSNGGYQAINIAVLAGAARIVLLGFDMHGSAGKCHWHAGHPVRNDPRVYASLMIPKFATMLPDLKKAGVEVVNVTPGSALRCFPMDTLEHAIKADTSTVQ